MPRNSGPSTPTEATIITEENETSNKESNFSWLGKSLFEDGNGKVFFKSFKKDGNTYSIGDCVFINPLELDITNQTEEVALPIVQIITLYEDTTNKQTKYFVQAQQFLRNGELPFLNGNENGIRNHLPSPPIKRKRGRPPKKKVADELEHISNGNDLAIFSTPVKIPTKQHPLELLPVTFPISVPLKYIVGACTVKDIAEINNFKMYTKKPNHFFVKVQQIEENSSDDTRSKRMKRKREDDDFEMDSSPKRKSKSPPSSEEFHESKVSPQLSGQKKFLSPIKDPASYLANQASYRIIFSPESPKDIFQDSSPRSKSKIKSPFKKIDKEELENSDDEERLYRKSLKRRAMLETQEKMMNSEQREKWEQRSINERFFRGKGRGRRRPEQKAMISEQIAIKKLVEMNIFDPEIPEGFNEDEVTTPPDLVLPNPGSRITIPDFRLLPDDVRNQKAELLFQRKYKASYMQTHTEEDENVVQKNPFVLHYFRPEEWTDEESNMFRELLIAYGCNWLKMSKLIHSKNWIQIEDYYVNNRYDLSCQRCGKSSDDDNLLLCEVCEKAYHTYCLDPPLLEVPTTAWYCSNDCETFNKKKCEVCKSTSDGAKMLLCDVCDSGYHTYCLDPPLEDIPEGSLELFLNKIGDWTCKDCQEQKKQNGQVKEDLNSNIEMEIDTPASLGVEIPEDPLVFLKNILQPKAENPDLQRSPKDSKKYQRKVASLTQAIARPIQYVDLKNHWFAKAFNTDMTLREDNLAFISYYSIFDIAGNVMEHKYNEHFSALLTATEEAVQKLVAIPVMVGHPKYIQTVLPSSPQPMEVRVRTPIKTERKKKKDLSDGYNAEPRSWIFQANQNIYDIESSVQTLKQMTWFVKQHIQKIKKGDKVYIWVSGKEAGILALATIQSDPKKMPEARGMKQFYKVSNLFDSVALRVPLKIECVLPDRLEKSIFQKNTSLSNLTILRQPIGTNFKMNKQEADALDLLVRQTFGYNWSISSSEDIEDIEDNGTATDLPNSKPSSPRPPSPKATFSITTRKQKKEPFIEEESSPLESIVPELEPEQIILDPNNNPLEAIISPVGELGLNLSEVACELCKMPTDDDKMLLCDRCDKGYHIYCLKPPLQQIPEGSWFCRQCSIINSRACHICQNSTSDKKIIVCDVCDEAYHHHCLNPELLQLPKDDWICENCKLTKAQVLACKMVLGFNELHLECRRLMQFKCEEASAIHRKNMMDKQHPKVVLKEFARMISELTNTRQYLLTEANRAWETYTFQLYQEYFIEPTIIQEMIM